MRITTLDIDLAMYARKYMDILGAPADMPLPTFRVTHRPVARWLARCTWNYLWPTTVIEVQRHMTQDPATLEQLVAHEVCHHVLNVRHGRMAYGIGHGPLFLAAAAKVNAVMGADYVTTANDACNSKLNHGKLPRPITLVLYKRPEKAPIVSWFQRVTPKITHIVKQTAARPGHEVRMVETRDGRWVNGIPRLATCRYAVPTGEMVARIDALWATASTVVVPV